MEENIRITQLGKEGVLRVPRGGCRSPARAHEHDGHALVQAVRLAARGQRDVAPHRVVQVHLRGSWGDGQGAGGSEVTVGAAASFQRHLRAQGHPHPSSPWPRTWPSTMLRQVGALESSKSGMYTLAPLRGRESDGVKGGSSPVGWADQQACTRRHPCGRKRDVTVVTPWEPAC